MKKIKKKRYIQRVWNKQEIVFDLLDIIKGYIIKQWILNYKDLIFVDLFWWGWSVSANATHYFNKIIYNEINKDIVDLFVWIQDNKLIKWLKYKWIPRDEFMKIKDKENKTLEENLILTIWSFGNDRRSYIYWKSIERRKELTYRIVFSQTEKEYKQYINLYNTEKVAHFEKYWWIWNVYIPDDDWETFKDLDIQKRRYYKFWKKSKIKREFIKPIDIEIIKKERWKMISKFDKKLVSDLENLQRLQNLENLERLERLENLERLERLESLGSLQRLEVYNKDYKEIKLPKPDKCIIYLDPPYRDTRTYETEFNYKEFDEYVNRLKEQWYTIFISEYNLPYWEVIWSKNKRWFISQTKDKSTWKEKLYLIKK